MSVPEPAARRIRRAIGIIRVSEVKGREGESFASPTQQRERIDAQCEREDLQLLRTVEEMDVSGGAPLSERHGVRKAIEAIEAGECDVIVSGYFDRMIRSLRVQAELVERVEAAGGQVLTVDVGAVSEATAGQWLTGTLHGAVAEYVRRVAKERAGEAQARAVERGVVPWPNIPTGYRLGEGGRAVPDPVKAPVVARAVQLRADGATFAEVRGYLCEQGIVLSYHGVTHLLRSRFLLGELHFGELVNLTAHEPIVDAEVWRAAQQVRKPRGRRAKSDRLLARLQVLRCASCGSRMVVGTQTSRGRSYPFYRCGRVREDCAERVTISAEMVEGAVVDAVRAALAGAEGRASIASAHREAEFALATAQEALDRAVRAFDGLGDEEAVRDRLVEFRQARDDARAHLDQLGGRSATVVVTVRKDWHRLTFEERRALISATVERVEVAPGRGEGRISVELFGE